MLRPAETSGGPATYDGTGAKEAPRDAQDSRLAPPLRGLLAAGPAGPGRLSVRLAAVAAVPARRHHPGGRLRLPEGPALPAGPAAGRSAGGLRRSRRFYFLVPRGCS